MKAEARGIVVVAENEAQMSLLFPRGHRLATARDEPLALIALSPSDDKPDWASIPILDENSRIEMHVVPVARDVLRLFKKISPALVLFAGEIGGGGLVRKELNPLLQRVKCPIGVVLASTEPSHPRDFSRASFLVPFRNNENSHFALRTALELDPDAIVTAAMVVPTPMEESERLARRRELEEALAGYEEAGRVVSKLLIGANPADLLTDEAEQHDTIVLGVGQGLVLVRAVLGDAPHIVLDDTERELVRRAAKPTVVLRAYQGKLGTFLSSIFTRGDRFTPHLTVEERVGVYREIRRSARPTQDFFVMTGSSAIIASVGLILDSAAVIIGAMLIAPLMSAIIGMGLAIVQGDMRFFGMAAKASVRGMILAMLVGLLVGLLDIGTEPTQEMLARTHPSLLDLVVAMVSGLAAAYALCRKNVSAALPGVAIAVALIPPLATVGLFTGFGMFSAAYGALLLFLTNLAAITLASGMVFTLLGFHPPVTRGDDTSRFVMFQRGFLGAGLVALAAFSQLVVLTVSDVRQTQVESTVRAELGRYLDAPDGNAHLVQLILREDVDGRLNVTAFVVSTENITPVALTHMANQLEEKLDQAVELRLARIPAGQVRSRGWDN